MELNRVCDCLNDANCGLFFLAGIDKCKNRSGSQRLTIHAARGAITAENEEYIRQCLGALGADIELRIRIHSPQELYRPDCLESFAKLFEHDQIISDPTGAFARVSKLTGLANAIRTQFPNIVERILWQSETSKLIVQLCNQDGPATTNTQLANDVETHLATIADQELQKTVTAAQVIFTPPEGKCTAIDTGSARKAAPVQEPAKKRGIGRLLARFASIAALIGFGAVSTASAKTPMAPHHDQLNMPGITALVGLTTLGENSYGLRNPYQAVGGLRLYFGDAGITMASAFSPPRPHLNDEDGPETQQTVPVVYGS